MHHLVPGRDFERRARISDRELGAIPSREVAESKENGLSERAGGKLGEAATREELEPVETTLKSRCLMD